MTVRVVDQFEIINIADDQRKSLPHPLGFFDCSLGSEFKTAAIEETGKLIRFRAKRHIGNQLTHQAKQQEKSSRYRKTGTNRLNQQRIICSDIVVRINTHAANQRSQYGLDKKMNGTDRKQTCHQPIKRTPRPTEWTAFSASTQSPSHDDPDSQHQCEEVRRLIKNATQHFAARNVINAIDQRQRTDEQQPQWKPWNG